MILTMIWTLMTIFQRGLPTAKRAMVRMCLVTVMYFGSANQSRAMVDRFTLPVKRALADSTSKNLQHGQTN
jgi:hypothetical protein